MTGAPTGAPGGGDGPLVHGPLVHGRPLHVRPLHSRLLRLRHTHLARLQTLVLFDGALVVGVLLALAELASAWTPLALPAAVAVAVKGYDVVAGLAGPLPGGPDDPAGAGGRHRVG